MKLVSMFICLLLSSIQGIAQQPANPLDAQVNVNDLGAATVARTYDNRYEGVKGFPTLLEGYVPGSVTLNGSAVPLKSVNYDMFHDDFLVLKNRVPVVLNKSMVSGFQLFNGIDTLQFINIKDSEGKPRYFQELVGAKVGLFKMLTKTLLEPNYTGAFSAHRNYAEFIQAQSYFVRKDDQKLLEIKNKKDVNQQFPELADKLKVFYKENQVDFKREDHLIALVVFINSALR